MKKSTFTFILFVCILAVFLPLAGKDAAPETINLKMDPAVFAVEDHYQILVTVKDQSLVRIKVGDKFYTDHVNGVRRSKRNTHRITVPMTELNKAGRYEVFCRRLPVRRAYMHKVKPMQEISKVYAFRKLPSDNIKIFHVADTHSLFHQPLKTVNNGKPFDLLILNGDIVDTVYAEKILLHPCLLAGKMTGGTIPVIYARGNHELRGPFAEESHYYTPHHNERSYYNIRLGSLHAMILDGGEDKADWEAAYGHTIDCNAFRLEQLDFIRQTAREKIGKEVKYRLVISHIPFPRYVGKSPADEKRRRFMVYGDWCKALKEGFSPQLILSGHLHYFDIDNNPKHPAPIILGTGKDKKNNYTCAKITLSAGKALVQFIGPDGKSVRESTLTLKK